MFKNEEIEIEIKKSDLMVIELDETQYWQEDFLKEYHIKKVFGVYLYDKNQHTYCCEMSPSYWFEYLYSNIEMEEEFTDDKYCDDAYNQIAENDSNDSMYMNVYDIDNKESVKVDEDFEYNSNNREEYDELFEKVHEYCCENHYI